MLSQQVVVTLPFLFTHLEGRGLGNALPAHVWVRPGRLLRLRGMELVLVHQGVEAHDS
jgi:hypothetical protein